MEAKELRIGNWVKYRDGKELVVSNLGDSFETVKFYNYNPSGSDDITEYSPMPLTEKWLIRFGFLLDLHHHRRLTYSLNRITTYMQDGVFWCDILYDCLEIKHVHQLQNLYFALTNDELKLILK